MGLSRSGAPAEPPSCSDGRVEQRREVTVKVKAEVLFQSGLISLSRNQIKKSPGVPIRNDNSPLETFKKC